MTDTLTVPRLRGRLHQVAFWMSIPAGLSLVALARGSAATLAAAVYAASLTGLYAASAAFHRLRVRGRESAWLRRLDHAMIYVLIAGTYTPFALLALEGAWRTTILAAVWTGAAGGVALRLSGHRFPVLAQTLYMTLGWTALFAMPAALPVLSIPALLLLFTGGLFYTGGAILFGLGRPTLRPDVFGYHEMWHACVVAASICHYALVLMLVVGATGAGSG